MTAQADPYVRVYTSIISDPKFEGVYGDDKALATWLRLLLIADSMYPAPGHLPLRVDMKAVEKLAKAGLIDLLPGDLYRFHGLEKERGRRSDAARQSANRRWKGSAERDLPYVEDPAAYATAMRPHSDRNATAMRPHADVECESDALRSAPLHSAPSSSAPTQDDDPLDAWYRLTASWPSPRIAPWLERLANDHGPADLIAALGIEWKDDPDRATVLGRVETRLKREAHERRKAGESAARAKAEEERKALEEMPVEQRRANMARLREEMAKAGLLPKEEAA